MIEPIVSFLQGRLDAYLDDLRTLVSIDSGSYDKAGVDAVNAWLEDRLTTLGFAVERYPQAEFGDDLLATLQGKGRGRILLLGHSDTVFPTGTAAERPMTIQGNTIRGPGTSDMKSGLLTGIYALEALREIGFDDYQNISYLCVSDEEIGERHSISLICSEARKADAVLTLETARENGDIVNARKGVCWYIVEAFGKSAHAGVEPEKGRNAIVALAHQIIALDKLNGLRPGMTVNMGYVKGGSTPNVVPDYAQIRVDLRAFSKDDMMEFEDAFLEQLAKTEIPGVKVAFRAEEGSYVPPMERTPAVAELEKLAQKAARELGFEVKGASTGGGSDASFAAVEGTPVLDGLGPIGGLDHSPDEYIELSSIVPRTALLVKLIIAISKRKGARMMDAQEVLNRLESKGIEHLWVIWHDYSGRSCTKTVPKERFAGIFEKGVVFARADLDFNLEDHMAPGSIFTAETGDFLAIPDPDSYAPIPYRNATARMKAFMRAEDGSAWEGCPRTQLQRMVEAYAGEGLSVRVAFEAEFTLFKSVGDGEYQPADADGMFTLAGLDRHYPLWQRVIDSLHGMGVAVEQLGKEYGPGQYEATTHYTEPLKAVDDYLTFKEVVRALAREAGWMASFMPKPYAHLPGCGLHLHLSVWDVEGKRDLSIGETDDAPLSPLGRHFLGGLLAHAPALAGAGSPIVNSYKRLLPGSWSPAHICWGVGNRAALVRIPSMGRRRHIEFRSGDNASNPLIFLTAVMAAGLDGICKQTEPPAPVEYDVGVVATEEEAAARGLKFLPRTLAEALAAFEADGVMAEALGPVIFSEFLKVKRSELAAYDLHVHPWERRMYLERI